MSHNKPAFNPNEHLFNHSESLNLKKMLDDNDWQDNTDNIRKIKHSTKIRDDVRRIENLKVTWKESDGDFLEVCKVECPFLYNQQLRHAYIVSDNSVGTHCGIESLKIAIYTIQGDIRLASIGAQNPATFGNERAHEYGWKGVCHGDIRDARAHVAALVRCIHLEGCNTIEEQTGYAQRDDGGCILVVRDVEAQRLGDEGGVGPVVVARESEVGAAYNGLCDV